MDQQLQDVNAAQTPVQEAPAAPTLAPEQFEQIKRSLIETLHKNYGQFISSIAHFPLLPMPMQQAFLHFDTGFLWFEKAIVNMPMPQVQVAEVPQQEAPSESLGQPNETLQESAPANTEAL
jgi:hypothetical protein